MDDKKLSEALCIYNNMMVNAYAFSEAEAEHEFSVEFERKMRKLIRLQKNPLYYATNTRKKRVALVAALIAILMMTACSVPAIREPIVNFVIEVYEDFTTLVFQGSQNEEAEVLEKADIIIPDGYTAEEISTEVSYFLEMTDNEGRIITFEQVLLSNTQISVDTENTTYENISINGLDGIYYNNKGMNVLVWSNDKYNYIISGNISVEELSQIAESVK